jgi:pyruvate/2-oxoglutarate dehydrogenase complex dihydrolipoamide dehydrogenase (E3) component
MTLVARESPQPHFRLDSATTKTQLLSKIHDHRAAVAVIGLGYVGLPLAVAFAESGFPVTFGCAQCRRRHRRRPQ